jgi:hypothetical protein
MQQAVSCRHVAEEALAQFHINSRKICGGRSENGIYFLYFHILLFPLSVLFHQYTLLIQSFIHLLIHSCITNANIITLNKAI